MGRKQQANPCRMTWIDKVIQHMKKYDDEVKRLAEDKDTWIKMTQKET